LIGDGRFTNNRFLTPVEMYCGNFAAMPVRVPLNLGNNMFVVILNNKPNIFLICNFDVCVCLCVSTFALLTVCLICCIYCEINYMYIYFESKKTTIFFVNNFVKCWSILKILSPLDSARNLQYNICHFPHHTLTM